MAMHGRLRGRDTQFYIELLYGLLFVGGFVFLVFRVDPRVAAFEGGLVVGYLLRVWEKMSIYERVLEDMVSREAETQVADEVEQQVGDEVREQVEDEVEQQVEDEIGDIGEQIDEQVAEQMADGDGKRNGPGGSPS